MAIKIFAYISPICWEAVLVQIYMKFCMRGHLSDLINRAKFYLNQIRGFDFVGVKFLASHRKEKWPSTQGLNYRSACDSWVVVMWLLWCVGCVQCPWRKVVLYRAATWCSRIWLFNPRRSRIQQHATVCAEDCWWRIGTHWWQTPGIVWLPMI